MRYQPFYTLQETYQDLTNSLEFKKWFGNSKIVDKDGNPLICYHVTHSDFLEFKPLSHFGTSGQARSLFTGRLNQLSSERKIPTQTFPVYLSIQNPLRINDKFNNSVQTLLEEHFPEIAIQYRAEIEQYHKKLHDEIEIPYEKAFKLWQKNWRNTPKPEMRRFDSRSWANFRDNIMPKKYTPILVKAFKQKGYDGLIYLNRYETDNPENEKLGQNISLRYQKDSYVIFDPSQVKSIFNKGTFNVNNNNIMEQFKPLLEAYKKVPNLLKLRADFERVGIQQRDLPERIMLKFTNALSGGVHAFLAEHIGDLSQRASLLTLEGQPLGYEYIKEKIRSCLHLLTLPYGFEKERLENLRDNGFHLYIKTNPSIKKQYDELEKAIGEVKNDEIKFHNAIDIRNKFYWSQLNNPEVIEYIKKFDEHARDIGRQYANAHRMEVHPLTTLQKLGRLAAIAVGEYNFESATKILQMIDRRIKQCKTKEELNDLYFEGYNG